MIVIKLYCRYLVKKGANVGAVNSEAELPIDIAEDDDMMDYLQSEIDKQGNFDLCHQTFPYIKC